jgi:hypothetical protein
VPGVPVRLLELKTGLGGPTPRGARSAASSAGPPPAKRPPPKAVKVLLPVWGYQYVRQFLDLGLPTLLAPGNVPALAQALPCQFEILTSNEDETFIRRHSGFARLASHCEVAIRQIDHLITASNSSTTITLAYTEAVRSVGPEMLDTCFVLLVSDYIVADGSLASGSPGSQKAWPCRRAS